VQPHGSVMHAAAEGFGLPKRGAVRTAGGRAEPFGEPVPEGVRTEVRKASLSLRGGQHGILGQPRLGCRCAYANASIAASVSTGLRRSSMRMVERVAVIRTVPSRVS